MQISPARKAAILFDELAEKLREAGTVSSNQYLLRLVLNDPEFEVTVFRDGRAIIKGTEDIGLARAIYSRYIGT